MVEIQVNHLWGSVLITGHNSMVNIYIKSDERCFNEMVYWHQ